MSQNDKHKNMFMLALCLLLGTTSCEKKSPPESANKSAEKKPESTDKSEAGPGKGRGQGRGRPSGPVPVRVVTVEKKVAPRVVEVMAALAGEQQADVFSKVTGRITFMGPKEGQPVKAGEVLFRVDRSDPGESFLSVPIVSPLSGWVGRWQVTNIGEQITPQDAVVTVVDDRLLRVTAYLPTEDWLEVRPDTQVKVIFGGTERRGRVVTIARAADRSSGRGSVTLEVDNPKRDWRSGTFARVTFAVEPKERMLLTAGALIITDEKAFVYTVEDQIVRRKAVQFATYDADTVDVTSGLEPGTRVVIAGANLLGDKSPVRIME